MEFSVLSKNPSQFLAITSLNVSEFEILHNQFAPICDKYFRYNTLDGLKRKIVTSKEHSHSLLRGTEQKLFFLLVYLKTNTLQEHQGASFGLSQTKVSRISRILLKLLNQTLDKMGLTPIRNSGDLVSALSDHPTKVFSYDGMERGILRNSCNEAQKEEYSGKKKAIE